LAKIDGLERIRYTPSHPNDMDDALGSPGNMARSDPSDALFAPCPVQSGPHRILKADDRSHNRRKAICG